MGHPVDSFAYDFLKVRGISAYDGDGGKLEQWWGYGAPILAAADGVVVEANQAAGLPERSPFLPHPSAQELGLNAPVLTNTLITLDGEGAHYRPGNVSWDALSPVERARINGAYAIIRHSDEEFSFYAHLQPGSLVVNPGDRVQAGQPIGRCGASGNASGAGLHFQVLYKPDMHAGLPVEFTPAGAPNVHLRLMAFGTYQN
jgi:murein DD-endopeptidase MepM/ murein hydrolase activator NlpD